jgi:hypothetical protein
MLEEGEEGEELTTCKNDKESVTEEVIARLFTDFASFLLLRIIARRRLRSRWRMSRWGSKPAEDFLILLHLAALCPDVPLHTAV